MAVDPSVQVAIVTTVATAITTGGVVWVARINNRKERGNAAEAGVEAGADLEEGYVLRKMLALTDENERKEGTITRQREEAAIQRAENGALMAENTELRLENSDLAAENAELRVKLEKKEAENE